MRFAPHFVEAVRARMEQRRGRKVSLAKVVQGVEKHLGSFAEEPFERLFSDCPDPWQVSLAWSGPEASGVEPIQWFHGRTDALRYLLDTVDRFRLYPTSVKTEGESIQLMKDGDAVLCAEPLSFSPVDGSLRSECLRALHCAAGGEHLKVLQALVNSLPNLAKLTPPYAWRETYWREPDGYFELRDGSYLHEHGMVTFEPIEAARRLRSVYADQNIQVDEEGARGDLAYLLGFSSWSSLLDRWSSLRAFTPFLVHERPTGRHVLVRDAASAMAMTEELCSGLKSSYTWRVKIGQHVDEFGVQIARTHSDANTATLRIEVKAIPAFIYGRPWERASDFEELTVEEASAVLAADMGVGLPVADRLELSRARSGDLSLQIGTLHISVAKSPSRFRSGRQTLEYLREADGWRDVREEKKLLELRIHKGQAYPWYGADLALRKRRPALGHLYEKGRVHRRLEFMPLFSLPRVSSADLDRLCDFLHYEQLDKDGEFWGVPESRSEKIWMAPADIEETFRSAAENFARFIPFHVRRTAIDAITEAREKGSRATPSPR